MKIDMVAHRPGAKEPEGPAPPSSLNNLNAI
jgi:hypothetical protein